MNKCLFIGRLTDDPVQYGEGDNVSSIFDLAVNRKYANGEGERDADFPKLVAFGKLSHLTQKALSKGTNVGVECHVRTSKNTKDGKTYYNTEFVVEGYTFIEKKRE